MLPRPLRREQGDLFFFLSLRSYCFGIPLFSSQRTRQHERGLAMRSYIGKGELCLLLEPSM